MSSKRTPATFRFDMPPHVLIIQSRYHAELADMQLKGVKAVLERIGAMSEVLPVPGVLEVPATIACALKALDFDPMRRRSEGYIVLGSIIHGDTPHAHILAAECTRSLQDLSTKFALAVGNGINIADSLDEARAQVDPDGLDGAGEAAEACLRMIEIKHYLRLTPKRRWVSPQT